MRGNVTLQSSAYGPAARHLYWRVYHRIKGQDQTSQTSGCHRRLKSELDTSSARIEVVKSFGNKLSLMMKSRFLPSHVCESFYLKVIQPSITYAMPVWGSLSQTELFKSLERQHCLAARIIFGFPSDMPTADVSATVK